MKNDLSGYFGIATGFALLTVAIVAWHYFGIAPLIAIVIGGLGLLLISKTFNIDL